MIRDVAQDPGPLSIVAVDIGNTTVGMGRWVEGDVNDVERVATEDRGAAKMALAAVRRKCENVRRQAIVIASVVPSATAWLAEHIENDLDLRAFVVGGNTPLPVEVAVREPSAVGVDRVCAAAAAFDHAGQGCTIIDVGSAVTIDVIDDEGIFRGGAILPGLRLQAQALADCTAKLPLIEPAVPSSAVGTDTPEAIQSGLCYGLVGAIRGIVEQIATEGNKWPQTILTGGGSELLKDQLDFVDNWVPNLCLMGAGLAYVKRVAQARGEA